MVNVMVYNELKLELQTKQSLYLQYATGLNCSSLENIQNANKVRIECKIIKGKIKKLEFCQNF